MFSNNQASNSCYLFEPEDYLQEQEFQQTLDADFFKELTEAQKQYQQKNDQQNMHRLIGYYTDCVSYFSMIQQPVSQYFQQKIKDLMKNIKCFGSPQQKVKNKQKLQDQVMKQMESQSIQKTMKTELKRRNNRKQLEKQSLRIQEQKLLRRIQKSKRSMTKSQSLTFSFGSIYSSPEMGAIKRKNRQQDIQIKQLRAKNQFLFQKDINSSQDEESTLR